MISIRTPIWSSQSIGIAASELTEHDIDIEITYTLKDGARKFPDTYTMHSSIIKRFPTQMIKGTKLHIVPISALVVKGVPPPTTYGE